MIKFAQIKRAESKLKLKLKINDYLHKIFKLIFTQNAIFFIIGFFRYKKMTF